MAKIVEMNEFIHVVQASSIWRQDSNGVVVVFASSYSFQVQIKVSSCEEKQDNSLLTSDLYSVCV